MKANNTVLDKSFDFAVHVVNAHKHLISRTSEYNLSRLFLTSGTRIAAHSEDAIGSVSTTEFLNSMTLAYKDARRTKFWVRLLAATGHFQPSEAESLLADVEELSKIIGSIQKTTRKSMDR